MKNLSKIAGILFLVLLLACSKKDEPPSTNDLLIDHPWNLQSVTVDNMTVDYYDGLILTFTSTSYSAVNGGSLWDPSGTWNWKDDTMTKIVRDDGLELAIESISAEELKLSFVWNSTVYESGRTESVEGDHLMVFTD